MTTFPTTDPIIINQAYRPNQRDILPIGVKDRNLGILPFLSYGIIVNNITIDTVADKVIIAEQPYTTFTLSKTQCFIISLYIEGYHVDGGGGETPYFIGKVYLDGAEICWLRVDGGQHIRIPSYNQIAGGIPAGEHKLSVWGTISSATGAPSYVVSRCELRWSKFVT